MFLLKFLDFGLGLEKLRKNTADFILPKAFTIKAKVIYFNFYFNPSKPNVTCPEKSPVCPILKLENFIENFYKKFVVKFRILTLVIKF